MKKLIGIVAVFLLMASTALADTSIKVDGSTTVLPIMQKVVEAYMKAHPDVKISVSGGGSGNGIKALIDGATDIAMASRAIEPKEIDLAKSKNITPTQTVCAIDAIVPIVNPANKLGEITLAQLKDLYMGKVTSWKDLGGEGPVVVISRDTSSGTYETWEGLVMKKERVFPGALMQASNGAVVQAVSKNKNAMGYVGIGYLDASTKGLKVDGIEPTPENAKSKKYPISRELYIYTNGAPAGAAKGLVDFLLSADGQKLVKEAGFVPLN
ncbi:PstS family phosphate ABC transporter substrate-binding protein [Desulfovibrio sp. TomC]|uniref:PstS family phosphate ABC transporter substrate-binding protein n=1 Tax=Desulfovibrio sp. TomC TaxID=1562888 RepID=UPI0005753C4C|nr:PstS family phosphate ABC transporter substrate-binding protein [Desulfovibrio sp. TomC]KHK03627.1 Phosphate ABC transporter, periplasmic phosphate-binding protein PstS [Desulfovibrio sp. TomC]